MPFLCSFSFSPNLNNTKIDILHNNFRCLFGPWTNNAFHINTFTNFILQHDQKKKRPAKAHLIASHIFFLTFCIRYYLWSYYEWMSIIFCGKSYTCNMHLFPHHFQTQPLSTSFISPIASRLAWYSTHEASFYDIRHCVVDVKITFGIHCVPCENVWMENGNISSHIGNH